MLDFNLVEQSDTVDKAVVNAVEIVNDAIVNDNLVEFLECAQAADKRAGEAFVSVIQGDRYRVALGVHIKEYVGRTNYIIVGNALDVFTGEKSEYLLPVM